MAILLPLFLLAAMIAFPIAAVIKFFLRRVEYQTIWNVVFVFSLVAALLLMFVQPSVPTEPQPTLSPTLPKQRTVISDLEQLEEEREYEATTEAIEELRRYELFQNEQEEQGRYACTCTHNAHDCADFATGNDAQACYQHCLDTTGQDVHWLDDDRDGSACEWSPRE